MYAPKVETSLERTSAAAATLRGAKLAGSFDRFGRLMARPKAAYSYAIIHLALANNFGLSLLRSTPCPGPSNGNIDKPPFTGATGTLLGYTLGWHEARHTSRQPRVDAIAVATHNLQRQANLL